MSIQFTTWEEWNDTTEKIKQGLVVCPDCKKWTDRLYKIPARLVGARNPHFNFEYAFHLDSFSDGVEYCCCYCMATRSDLKNKREYEKTHDKCSRCGNWYEKGVVILYKGHRMYMPKKLCKSCVEQDEKERAARAFDKKESTRVEMANNRTKKYGLVSDLSLDEWKSIIEKHENKCVYCGGEWSDLEHVIPVSRGGGTTVGNVVTSCRSCNSKKGRNLIQSNS